MTHVVYGWRTTTRISHRCHDCQGQRSKVKVARSCDQSEQSWPIAVSVSLEAGVGILYWLNPVDTLLVVINVIIKTNCMQNFHDYIETTDSTDVADIITKLT